LSGGRGMRLVHLTTILDYTTISDSLRNRITFHQVPAQLTFQLPLKDLIRDGGHIDGRGRAGFEVNRPIERAQIAVPLSRGAVA